MSCFKTLNGSCKQGGFLGWEGVEMVALFWVQLKWWLPWNLGRGWWVWLTPDIQETQSLFPLGSYSCCQFSRNIAWNFPIHCSSAFRQEEHSCVFTQRLEFLNSEVQKLTLPSTVGIHANIRNIELYPMWYFIKQLVCSLEWHSDMSPQGLCLCVSDRLLVCALVVENDLVTLSAIYGNRWREVTVLMSESLNHSLSQFVKKNLLIHPVDFCICPIPNGKLAVLWTKPDVLFVILGFWRMLTSNVFKTTMHHLCKGNPRTVHFCHMNILWHSHDNNLLIVIVM